jgi:hypothetical protein
MTRWTVVALVLLLVAPAAGAPPKRSPFAEDARLDVPVTVRWKRVPLSEALLEVSRAARVRLAAAPYVADEPVIAAASGLPARSLLEQIAALTHFTWIRSGGTPEAPAYLLTQSLAAQQEEQAEIERGEREVVAALERELARHREISRLSPEQLQQELEKADRELSEALAGGISALASDPAAAKRIQAGQVMRAVASPVGRTMLELLDRLTPQQWQQLRADESLVFSAHPGPGEFTLPPEILDRLRSAQPTLSFPRSLLEAFGGQAAQALDQLEQMIQNQWSQAGDFRVTVQLNRSVGAQPAGMLRVSPEPLGGDGLGPLSVLTGLMISGAPEPQKAGPEEDPAAREKRLSEDPLLGKKAVLKLPPLETPREAQPGFMAVFGSGYRLADVLPLVEEAFGVRLLADVYARQAMLRVSLPRDTVMPLYKVLDTLAGSTRTWTQEGDFIRLRSRTWAHDRRAEIPVRHLRRWKALRERQGGFTLDDLAEIASTLRDEQLESLVFATPEDGNNDGMGNALEFTTASANRHILRFYRTLLPPQRGRLQAGQPLPVASLLAGQQAALVDLNRAQNRSMLSLAMGTKPARRPEHLARATLVLERSERPGPPAGGAFPGSAGAEDAGTRKAPAGPNPSLVTYTFRLLFPDGQKDDYTLMATWLPPRAASPSPRKAKPR